MWFVNFLMFSNVFSEGQQCLVYCRLDFVKNLHHLSDRTVIACVDVASFKEPGSIPECVCDYDHTKRI